MSKNDGGPAFPVADLVGAGLRSIDVNPTTGAPSGAGASLRDVFAWQALPAVIAAYVEANGRCIGTDHVKYNCAGHAYQFADAMLAERAKEQP